jgi:hypothetical protein
MDLRVDNQHGFLRMGIRCTAENEYCLFSLETRAFQEPGHVREAIGRVKLVVDGIRDWLRIHALATLASGPASPWWPPPPWCRNEPLEAPIIALGGILPGNHSPSEEVRRGYH